MSFHPNDVLRRGRAASVIVCGALVFLLSGFFRTQVLKNKQLLLQSEENRLRQIPLPAPRGLIYDRNGKLIADNAVGYSIALLTESEDSLRANLTRLRGTIAITNRQFEQAITRYRRDRGRPVVILPDASFDVVSMLEEHRLEFPNLIIQSAPKRIYPAGKAVGAFAGYISEINESELATLAAEGYKPGQQIGKQGLEKQYEARLRGREGAQFVEVDSRGRIVSRSGARPDIPPEGAPPLKTNIDLDLQTFMESQFGDSLSGGAVALDPNTGGVLAIYSSPAVDPNRFIGGVPIAYFDSLQKDPRKPLYNKALQGRYAPGSVWKLATALVALEDSLVTFKDRFQPCAGFYYFGNRAWKCWEKKGHGSLDLTGAIAHSCDVYFYQLGQRIGLTRLVAGGVKLGFRSKTGIDLPEEFRAEFPDRVPQYFDQKHGPRNWTAGSTELNMSIGQGENSQTVVNMARFYAALATNGKAPVPRVAADSILEGQQLFQLPADQALLMKAALVGVVATGTAAASAIQGVKVAGKTGTAQSGRFAANGEELNHAWFVGYAPADKPKIVVAVMLEYVPYHGSVTARMATAIISRFLHAQAINQVQTEG